MPRNALNVRVADPAATPWPSRFVPYRILLVEDEPAHRTLMRDIFSGEDYEIQEASGVAEAIESIGSQAFDVVVLDYYLPDGNGGDLCRSIRRIPEHKLLPLLVVTGAASAVTYVECLRAGASDVIRKPYSAIELEARVRSAGEHKRLLDRMDDAESMLFSIARLIEARDPTTGHHGGRVARLSEAFGLALGLPIQDWEALRRGAMLHDIGKIAIPDAILLKPGPLDAREWEIVRQHPIAGAEICSRLRTMRSTLDIIRSHHERWDGGGYPDGLAGGAIPYLARVFQVVHAFDALASARPYRPALPVPEVLSIMESEAERGKLDPTLTATFVNLMRTDSTLAFSVNAPRAPATFQP